MAKIDYSGLPNKGTSHISVLPDGFCKIIKRTGHWYQISAMGFFFFEELHCAQTIYLAHSQA